jgi:hypothetical protein
MATRVGTISFLLLLSVCFAGIAHIALLPPFEGYDETAHFSYIQQLADTGRIPVYGEDRLSADIAAYRGPMAAPAGQPYRDFFRSGGTSAIADSGPTQFRPGAGFDWEAQHPPLFYLAMVLPYRALAGLPWRWHLLGLRLASWAIGFAGFAWGALATQRLLRRRGLTGARLLLPVAWPLLFPEFLPELARLTNDSLCILLLATAWWLLIGWIEGRASIPRALALAAALGAGLLTKAFFLSITAGAAALLLAAALRRGNRERWLAFSVPLLAAALGAPWYLAKLRATGSVTGAGDLIGLAVQGGLLQGLDARFSIFEYLRGLAGIVSSFCWAGTWSFVLPSRVFLLPVAALALLPLAGYIARARRLDLPALAPLFVVGPMVLGLCYHLLATIAATGLGIYTTGWYLHIFAAPLSLALVLGWPAGAAMRLLLVYALAFSAAMACMQLAFFSGCLPRAGVEKMSLLAADCLLDLARLRVIALPDVGLPALAVSLSAALLAGVLLLRRRAVQTGAG